MEILLNMITIISACKQFYLLEDSFQGQGCAQYSRTVYPYKSGSLFDVTRHSPIVTNTVE